jgi:DNA-binding MarR family transcriptional regulator
VTQIAQGLRRIVKALHAYSQEVRSAYGLTGPQLWALKTLQREGGMPVGRLAQRLAVHQSSLSILLDRLEKRGLVRRVRGRPDRRVVQAQLTPRGRATVADAPDAAQGRLLHALSTRSLAELAEIRGVIDGLVAAMEAGDMTARFFFSDE